MYVVANGRGGGGAVEGVCGGGESARGRQFVSEGQEQWEGEGRGGKDAR